MTRPADTAAETSGNADRTGAGPVRLCDVALAAVANTLPPTNGRGSGLRQEEVLLDKIRGHVCGRVETLDAALDACLRSPPHEDRPLFFLARELRLSVSEMLAVALAALVETDLVTGRLLAHIQSPIGGSRPSLGLMARAFRFGAEEAEAVLPKILTGKAMQTGLLVALDESAPVPERAVRVPVPTCLALTGRDGRWPNAVIGLEGEGRIPLTASMLEYVARHAAALSAMKQAVLVIRTASQLEGRAVASAIAVAQDRRAVFLSADELFGVGPWILLRNLLPVFCLELSPGELRRVPELPGYGGPAVVLCGPDGSIETAAGGAAVWTLDVPAHEERRTLWQAAVGDSELASEIGKQFRHGAGRIAQLGRLARHYAALEGRSTPNRADILEAAWTGEGGGLDALAEPLRARIPDEALVTTEGLRHDLEVLLMRCRMRDELVSGLGVSATTRYRPGLRALFTGPSGTGKTLAAGWIATRLNLPLYRVDLASVTSKYIGETEKNLSQLLARAEQSEVILLFDEADSLFGKRTDVSDSNDRFANAQTNYLLQRIENYDGIVLLTSNSQSRFDPAFTRRLDFTIEFPQPGPEERRAIWMSHLGPDSSLSPAELNQLAAQLDVGGGTIRNVVLAAAAFARDAGRGITFDDVVSGLQSEYRKLGRQLPVGLHGR